MRITLTLNGKKKNFDVPLNRTLRELLRSQGLWSVQQGCESGICGSCTVLLDGKAVNSCIMLAVQADGKSVTTYEAFAESHIYDSLFQTLMEFSHLQCGFCMPGMFISLKALLDKNPEPSPEEIHDAIAGNICFCTGNRKPLEEIVNAVKKIRGEW
ncbi:MAG: (2Fe-2S)-binding protein [Calditrichaeota bacterium]|nr:MAG: (2Fe-2S)-binding protein [Calditrichota bacterium]